ncbi:hypothetical protein RFN58_04825 [Streptomyces iakyrus]|uniref:hypothetical protein n=1 Tax=Streptomyces iakyrus TaxID=68219 RepID=UPI001428AB4C|nr:hypothetical protein [Streptomyces iakyrus]
MSCSAFGAPIRSVSQVRRAARSEKSSAVLPQLLREVDIEAGEEGDKPRAAGML